MMVDLNKRYKLKKGKFGCYFYDSKVKVDLSLEMVLNRLNLNDNRITLLQDKNSFQSFKMYELRDDIIELKNRLRVYEKP